MRARGLDQFCRWWVILGAHETYTPVLDHRFGAVGGERRQNVERRVHRSITVVPGVLLARECGVLFASVSSAPSEPVDGLLSGADDADGADEKSPPPFWQHGDVNGAAPLMV